MALFWNKAARRVGSEYRRTATVVSFNHDGLELARIKNERRGLPFWHIAVFIYLVLLIRLIAMADVGPAAYGSRLDKMREGNIMERAAARVMAMDPVSQSIANNVRSGMRDMGFD